MQGSTASWPSGPPPRPMETSHQSCLNPNQWSQNQSKNHFLNSNFNPATNGHGHMSNPMAPPQPQMHNRFPPRFHRPLPRPPPLPNPCFPTPGQNSSTFARSFGSRPISRPPPPMQQTFHPPCPPGSPCNSYGGDFHRLQNIGNSRAQWNPTSNLRLPQEFANARTIVVKFPSADDGNNNNFETSAAMQPMHHRPAGQVQQPPNFQHPVNALRNTYRQNPQHPSSLPLGNTDRFGPLYHNKIPPQPPVPPKISNIGGPHWHVSSPVPPPVPPLHHSSFRQQPTFSHIPNPAESLTPVNNEWQQQLRSGVCTSQALHQGNGNGGWNASTNCSTAGSRIHSGNDSLIGSCCSGPERQRRSRSHVSRREKFETRKQMSNDQKNEFYPHCLGSPTSFYDESYQNSEDIDPAEGILVEAASVTCQCPSQPDLVVKKQLKSAFTSSADLETENKKINLHEHESAVVSNCFCHAFHDRPKEKQDDLTACAEFFWCNECSNGGWRQFSGVSFVTACCGISPALDDEDDLEIPASCEEGQGSDCSIQSETNVLIEEVVSSNSSVKVEFQRQLKSFASVSEVNKVLCSKKKCFSDTCLRTSANQKPSLRKIRSRSAGRYERSRSRTGDFCNHEEIKSFQKVKSTLDDLKCLSGNTGENDCTVMTCMRVPNCPANCACSCQYEGWPFCWTPSGCCTGCGPCASEISSALCKTGCCPAICLVLKPVCCQPCCSCLQQPRCSIVYPGNCYDCSCCPMTCSIPPPRGPCCDPCPPPLPPRPCTMVLPPAPVPPPNRATTTEGPPCPPSPCGPRCRSCSPCKSFAEAYGAKTCCCRPCKSCVPCCNICPPEDKPCKPDWEIPCPPSNLCCECPSPKPPCLPCPCPPPPPPPKCCKPCCHPQCNFASPRCCPPQRFCNPACYPPQCGPRQFPGPGCFPHCCPPSRCCKPSCGPSCCPSPRSCSPRYSCDPCTESRSCSPCCSTPPSCSPCSSFSSCSPCCSTSPALCCGTSCCTPPCCSPKRYNPLCCPPPMRCCDPPCCLSPPRSCSPTCCPPRPKMCCEPLKCCPPCLQPHCQAASPRSLSPRPKGSTSGDCFTCCSTLSCTPPCSPPRMCKPECCPKFCAPKALCPLPCLPPPCPPRPPAIPCCVPPIPDKPCPKRKLPNPPCPPCKAAPCPTAKPPPYMARPCPPPPCCRPCSPCGEPCCVPPKRPCGPPCIPPKCCGPCCPPCTPIAKCKPCCGPIICCPPACCPQACCPPSCPPRPPKTCCAPPCCNPRPCQEPLPPRSCKPKRCPRPPRSGSPCPPNACCPTGPICNPCCPPPMCPPRPSVSMGMPNCCCRPMTSSCCPASMPCMPSRNICGGQDRCCSPCPPPRPPPCLPPRNNGCKTAANNCCRKRKKRKGYSAVVPIFYQVSSSVPCCDYCCCCSPCCGNYCC